MSRRLAALLIVLGGCASKKPGAAATDASPLTVSPRLARAVPALDLEILEHPDKLELVTLDPRDPRYAGPDALGGYKPLGRVAIKDAATRRLLVAQLYDAVAAGGAPAPCFEPDQALHAERGGQHVDVLVSLQCANFRVMPVTEDIENEKEPQYDWAGALDPARLPAWRSMSARER